MNKKQRALLENRKKELKKEIVPFKFFLISGVCFCLTLIGLPIGVILLLIGRFGIDKKKKELNEIEYKLLE